MLLEPNREFWLIFKRSCQNLSTGWRQENPKSTFFLAILEGRKKSPLLAKFSQGKTKKHRWPTPSPLSQIEEVLAAARSRHLSWPEEAIS
jgi:hypothetical protein